MYSEQNILACMASATNLCSQNTTFWDPPPQLLDVLLDHQVVRMHRSQMNKSFDKCTGNCWRSHKWPGDVNGIKFCQHMLLTAHLVSTNSCVYLLPYWWRFGSPTCNYQPHFPLLPSPTYFLTKYKLFKLGSGNSSWTLRRHGEPLHPQNFLFSGCLTLFIPFL